MPGGFQGETLTPSRERERVLGWVHIDQLIYYTFRRKLRAEGERTPFRGLAWASGGTPLAAPLPSRLGGGRL